MGDGALGKEGAGASRDQSGWGGLAGAAAVPSLDLSWDADGRAQVETTLSAQTHLLPALSFFSSRWEGF